MNLYPLLRIIADGNFHSGEDLGKSLKVSRTAIWKQMKSLKELGLDFHSVSGKGYRLLEPLDLLDKAKMCSLSDKNPDTGLGQSSMLTSRDDFLSLVNSMELHLTIDSTNTQAMRKIQQKPMEKVLVLAEQQTQGRGRRGRQWVSPFARNLYLSLGWPFLRGPGGIEGLSLAIAMIVVKALNRCGYEDLTVKWPNDILLDKKKLAGILLEMHGSLDGPCSVVIGVGLNIDMSGMELPEITQPWTDLNSNFEAKPGRNRIAACLVEELMLGLEEFVDTGFSPYRDNWEKLDIYRGKMVEVHYGNHSKSGLVKGVNKSGALLLETEEGIEEINGGEVFPSIRQAGQDNLELTN